MRLLIISHTAHYIKDGEICWSWSNGKRNQLACTAFDQVFHLAFLHPGPAPRNALPYKEKILRLLQSSFRWINIEIQISSDNPRSQVFKTNK